MANRFVKMAAGMLLSFLVSSATFSMIIRHDEKDDSYLNFAKEKDFESVGYIQLLFINPKTKKHIESYCTGTLIDKRTVITSADCIEPAVRDPKMVLAEKSRFSLGNDLYSEKWLSRGIGSVAYYPEYKHGIPGRNAQNIALLYLTEPVPETIKPARFFTGNTQSVLLKNIAMVGFGYTGDPSKGVASYIDYQKRAVAQKVKNYKRTMIETSFDRDSDLLNGMFTHGDQGGPAFIRNSEGEWFLLGINTYRVVPEILKEKNHDDRLTPYGSLGFTIALPAYLDWIEDHLGSRKSSRNNFGEDSEWSFRAHWKNHKTPGNDKSEFWDVSINQPGTLLYDEDVLEIDSLHVNHEGARVIIPLGKVLLLSREQEEELISEIYKEKGVKEAVAFRHSLIKRINDENILRQAELKAWNVEIQEGELIVDGKLTFQTLSLYGGVLKGSGELLHSTEALKNLAGIVKPGGQSTPGRLKVWGDFLQADKGDQYAGGLLEIRVDKSMIGKSRSRSKIKHDLLDVGGQVQLGGALKIVETGIPLAPGDEFYVINSTNGLRGTFSRVEAPGHLRLELDYRPYGVKVTVRPVEIFSDLSDKSALELGQGQVLKLSEFLKAESVTLLGGIFEGSGTVETARFLFEDGVLNPESKDLVAEVRVTGDYTQNGGLLSMRIRKYLVEERTTTPEGVPVIHPSFLLENDTLKIQGDARLGGELKILLEPDCNVKAGERFSLVRANSISGAFDLVHPFKGVLQPRIEYTDTEVVLTLVAGKYSDLIEIKDPVAKNIAQYLDSVRGLKSEKLYAMFNLLDRIPANEIETFLLTVIKNHGTLKRMQEVVESQK